MDDAPRVIELLRRAAVLTSSMGNLASDDPNDISNHLARLAGATQMPDGSYLVRARLKQMEHLDGFIRSLQLTVVHKLGVGTRVEGPVSEPPRI